MILSYGSTREAYGKPEDHFVALDLAGALGGKRRARLDELLVALEPQLRATIVHAEATRSKEVLHVRTPEDIDPLRAAVQAWADRISRWP